MLNARCKFFTYGTVYMKEIFEKKRCYLKTGLTDKRPAEGKISGPKYCPRSQHNVLPETKSDPSADKPLPLAESSLQTSNPTGNNSEYGCFLLFVCVVFPHL